jgi:pyruvate dehydrogenase E2 component (dihydrolipoamide acetyltransferase)
MVGLDKVEDESDIQNVSASVGGESGVEEKKPTHQDVTDEDSKPESTSTIDTSDLPPHIILGMPALSPTMVRPF